MNTSLILVIVMCTIYDNKSGLLTAVFCGFWQDIFVSKFIGINIILYLTIALIINGMKEDLFKDSLLSPIFMITISTIYYHFVFYFLMYFFKSTIIVERLIEIILIEMVYNATIIAFVYKIIFEKVYDYKIR